MKIYTNKKRIIISSIILIILLSLVFLNFNVYKDDESFDYISFILSIVVSIISCVIFAIKFELKDKVNLIFTIISFVISILFSYMIIELLNQNELFALYTKRLVFNFIVIIFLHLFIYALTSRVRVTIILSNSLLFILGVINYTVTCFRGTPLVPWDFLSLKAAAYVASSYTFEFNHYLLLAIPLFAFIISIGLNAKYVFKNIKINLVVRFSSLIVVLCFTIVFYKTDIIDYFDFENNLWKPYDEYSNNGFLASFVKQSKNLFNDEPENYSPEAVEAILAELEEDIYQEEDSETDSDSEDDDDKPNIIVIMNESFSDLTVNRRF